MMLANRILTMTTKHQYMIDANKLKTGDTANTKFKKIDNWYEVQWNKVNCDKSMDVLSSFITICFVPLCLVIIIIISYEIMVKT